MTKRAIYVGRWSPFHKGHLAIMQKKIDEKKPLLILVRDTPYDLYSPMLRKRMIEAAMAKLGVDAKVMIIDDIESINYGRGVGYEINEIQVPENTKRISATQVREMIHAGDSSWRDFMPEGADKVLEDYISRKGLVVWFSGFPKSGKSTISKMAMAELEDRGIKAELLDGTTLRQSISKDLSFSKDDRLKNLERATYIAKLLSRNGAVVIGSFITPFQSQRDNIRKSVSGDAGFVQVHIKASLETCKSRDTDKLYSRAQAGDIPDFTGVSHPYEEPKNPDLVLDTENKTAKQCAVELADYITNLI